MLFAKRAPLPVILCERCKGTGYIKAKHCPTCHGMSMGWEKQDTVLYFGQPLNKYHIAVRRGRRLLRRCELVGALFLAIGLFGLCGWKLYLADISSVSELQTLWGSSRGPFLFFWLGVLMASFAVYVGIHSKHSTRTIEQSKRDERSQKESFEVPNTMAGDTSEFWKRARKMSRRKRRDISQSFTRESEQVLEHAFHIAEKQRQSQILPAHLFYALLASPNISGIFLRLGISAKAFQEKIALLFEKTDVSRMPTISPDVMQILFHAYEEARDAKQPFVDVTELVVATVRQSEQLQELLYDLNIDQQKLSNVIAWVRIREKLHRQYVNFRRAASHRNKYGLDRAMTAVATPFLNNFSMDLTMAAVFGRLEPCVGRDKEIDDVFRVIESGRAGVLLVGDYGVGKMSIIEGVVERLIEDDVPDVLLEKRMVQLSSTALLAGTTVSGAQERLLQMMDEIARAKNIVLFINNLHDLIGGSDDTQGLDVSDTLAEFMGSGRVIIFATTTVDGYNRHITHSQIGNSMTRIDVNEMNEDQAIQVLEANVGGVEYKESVFFSYDALAAAVQLAVRFIHDQPLPQSALELMKESAGAVRAQKGPNQLVARDDVALIVHEKTGIPVTSIGEDESAKLLRLEDAMHKRMIGQQEAVEVVANALRRARAEIRSTKRPIATFLFLGSTGVGKTELAKTIAEIYFGGEDRMVRVDMSEYQDASSVYRLIGQPGMQGTGLLTEAVRQQPFSLVLLDELEKADPKILDLFLQVFDDGRLTDSVGRVIDFTNTIIIATSNAGTSFIQEGIRNNKPVDDIREQLVRNELRKFYRPEFLNRFDGVVVFTPLTEPEIRQIAALMLKRVESDLEKRGIALKVTETGLDELASVGFDPEFGARPMRRAIQEMVENKLAEMVLAGQLKRRDTVVFDGKTGMRVERP